MKKIFRILIFIIFFQAEIHVRAAGDLIQEPAACMKGKETCALHVVGRAYHHMKNGVNFHAAEGSTVVRNTDHNWNFVAGRVWIEDGDDLEFQSVYATLKTGFGQYWIIDQNDRILIRNMSSDLKVTLRDGRQLELPEGFEVWISGLNSDGKTEYGMVKPIEMKEHIALWGGLYNGNKKSFKRDLLRFKERWGNLPEKSSQIYRALVDRKVASDKEEQAARASLLAKKKADQQKIKNIIYERTFGR